MKYSLAFALLVTSPLSCMKKDELCNQLLGASRIGDLKTVKECISAEAPINCTAEDNRTPLYYALLEGNLEVAQFLLEQPGIDLNIRSSHLLCTEIRSPLHLIVQNHSLVYPENVTTFEQKKVFAKQQNKLALQLLRKLIEKGANINEVAGSAGTPLHYALSQPNQHLAKSLIDADASMQELPISFMKGVVSPLQFCAFNDLINPAYTTILLKSHRISMADLLWSLRVCKHNYHKISKQEQKVLQKKYTLKDRYMRDNELRDYAKQKAIYALKGRILKAYYFTLLGCNFWPDKEGWKSIGSNRFPLDLAKIIASQAAWNAEHTIKLDHLETEQIKPGTQEFEEKLFDIYELELRCQEQLLKNSLSERQPSFEEFKVNLSEIVTGKYNHIYKVTENGRLVAAFAFQTHNLRFYYLPYIFVAWLKILAVDPLFQHQKIGSTCLKTIENLAKNQNCKFLRVEHSPKLAPFFEKNGFTLKTQEHCSLFENPEIKYYEKSLVKM